MIYSIEINNGIKHDKVKFEFQQGTTAIVGPNGCGKSLLAEFIAFGLFGSCALRGKVADYKDLEVKLSVNLNKDIYYIIRTTKDCRILQRGSILCTGTKPCNSFVIKLLGYNYSVYKMGNYAEQLDILGLGKMKPSERKQAMDMVLGLGYIDELVKDTNNTSLQYKHTADGISSVLTEVIEPVKPEGYEPTNKLLEEHTNLANKVKAFNEALTRITSFEIMSAPKQPTTDIDISSDEIMAKLREKMDIEQRLNFYKSSAIKPEVSLEELDVIEKQWEAYDQYMEYCQKLSLYEGEEPEITEAEAMSLRLDWQKYEEYKQKESLYNIGLLCCPKCGETFNPNFKEPLVAVLFPKKSKSYLEEQERRIKLKTQRDLLTSMKVEPVSIPSLSRSDIIAQKAAITNWEKVSKTIPELEKQLESYAIYTDEILKKRFEYEGELNSYKIEMRHYEEAEALYKQDKELVQKESPIEEKAARLEYIQNIFDACRIYERDLLVYERDKQAYDLQKAKLDEALKQCERYKKGSENLKIMKGKIKQFVLPSLSKVSSRLLTEMSDGLYNQVQVDEDFNVLVNGKEINLFSGSEQAMINLALRLGLGQVLTYKTFSVFIGDEIDASMRDERAQLTADCLRKVSKYIKQTILISHRDIEADHYIKL